ncbi:MAG: dUTP diphosphatase [Holosporaceae bacterium]|jgi:dUTP pyrophosphatase|nr:dUTP diphosphatase [Holosporaceae bacterium]
MLAPIKILEHGVGIDIPRYATDGSAGLDLPAAVDNSITIKIGTRFLVPTGFSIAIPTGFEGQIRPRSGLANKHGITVLNSPGTVDSDYRGELKVLLINLGECDFVLERGMRIAQMVIHRCEQVMLEIVDSLAETVRAEGGYGSTGIR